MIYHTGAIVIPPPTPSTFVFDDGAPGVSGDVHARADHFCNLNLNYFEPRHSVSSATPTRVIHATPTGTGNGLTAGSATSVERYLTGTGVTPAPGDQVRVHGGTHTINASNSNVVGTTANPIRFVRDDPAIIPTLAKGSGSRVVHFAEAKHMGFHGMDFDGLSSATWAVVFGRSFTSQTGLNSSCNFVDLWHNNFHNVVQECLVVSGGTGGAPLLASDFHVYGGSGYNTGANGTTAYGELFYFGQGNDTSDHVDNVTIEGVELYDSEMGEAIDFKQQQTGAVVSGCHIYDIDLHSQGAITAQTSEIDVIYTIIHDVKESTDTSVPVSGFNTHYEGHGITMQGGIVDHCLIYETDGAAIGYNDHLAPGGTQTIAITNTTVFDNRIKNTFYETDMLHWSNAAAGNSAGYATVTISNCISEDGVGNSEGGNITDPALAASADFVGPITGHAVASGNCPGSGFELATSSGIPASSGAMGKA